jgi:hypothetical protein
MTVPVETETKICTGCGAQGARTFRCRGCNKRVGPFCENCWLDRKLYEKFERACTKGHPHPAEKQG